MPCTFKNSVITADSNAQRVVYVQVTTPGNIDLVSPADEAQTKTLIVHAIGIGHVVRAAVTATSTAMPLTCYDQR